MHKLEVGGLLLSGQTKFQEGAYLEYTESGPMLIIAASNPTEKEIAATKSGKAQFAFYETDILIWFLYRIEGFGTWSDCPFSIRMYDGRGMHFDWSEEIAEGMGLGLHIVQVDARTGIIQAQRLLGLPTEFSRQFRAAILRQLERPFTIESYHKHINDTYARFSTKELLQRASFKTRPD